MYRFIITLLGIILSFPINAQDDLPEIQYFGWYKEIDKPYSPMARLLGDVDYCQIAVDYAEGLFPANNALLAINMASELDENGDIPLDEYTFAEIIEMIDNGNLPQDIFLNHSFYIYLEPEINYKKKSFTVDLYLGDQLELQTADENFKHKKCWRFNSPQLDEETVADIRNNCDEVYLFVNLVNRHIGNSLIATPLKIVLSNSETGKYYYVYDAANAPSISVSSAPHIPQADLGDEGTDVSRHIQELPYFTGGDAAIFRYIRYNLKIPKEIRDENINGRMIASITIDKDGSVSDVVFTRSLHPLLDKEAKRVLLNMPKWLPARNNGCRVTTTFVIPIAIK